MFTYEPEIAVACNFNYLFENEGLLKVTASHAVTYMHCKCGNISETVPDRVVVTTDRY